MSGGWRARVLLFVVPGLWSTNYLIAKLSNGVIGPHALALGRWALAVLLLLPFTWRGLRGQGGAWHAEWRHLLVLGGLGMYICGAWVYIAARTTSSTNIALIYAVTPVTIAAVSAHVLHERLRPPQLAGIGLAFAGVLFVITRGDPQVLLQMRFAPGDFWIMAAAASWTAYSVLLKRWPSRLGPFERLVAISLGGLAWLVPAAIVEAVVSPGPPLGWRAAGLVVAAAIVPGALSYGAYAHLQRHFGASRTALLLHLAPVYGALGAWAVLGERLGWHHAIGGALILASIGLATRR